MLVGRLLRRLAAHPPVAKSIIRKIPLGGKHRSEVLNALFVSISGSGGDVMGKR